MAREFARIYVSIDEDKQFRDLSIDAQWLYTRVLLPEKTLNYAGVADWRPKRLVGKAADSDMPRILAAAAEFEEAHLVLVDTDTEEILARSYIRRDDLLRNPRMAVAVVRAIRSVASPTLRAAIVTELRRIRHERPEYSCWTSPLVAEDLAALLAAPDLEAVGGYRRQLADHTGPPPASPVEDRDARIPAVSIADQVAIALGRLLADPHSSRLREVLMAPLDEGDEAGHRALDIGFHPSSGPFQVVRR